jgi:hypothetical protein
MAQQAREERGAWTAISSRNGVPPAEEQMDGLSISFLDFRGSVMSVLSRFLLISVAQILIAFSAQAQFREQRPALDWRTFVVPEYGTKIDYPAGIFVPAGDPEKGVGQRFDRPDGRAVLSIYSRNNDQGDTPASYLRKNLRMERSAIGYQRVTRGFFAISMEREGLIFYSWCNFSRRGAIHCFDLVYPKEEERAWDAVVTRISLSLRPLGG